MSWPFLFKDTCENGDVRLRDGLDPSNGRVEICQYERWGAMCTNKWDRDDARVVCQQLGYNHEGCPYMLIDMHYTCIVILHLDARSMKGVGEEENQLVFMSQVDCNGSEQTLEMCSTHKLLNDSVSCSQGNIVGVTCGRRISEA